MTADTASRRSIDALVGSLEFLTTLRPELTLEDALPVVDIVLAEHGVDRGDAVRVDELLVIALYAQANA